MLIQQDDSCLQTSLMYLWYKPRLKTVHKSTATDTFIDNIKQKLTQGTYDHCVGPSCVPGGSVSWNHISDAINFKDSSQLKQWIEFNQTLCSE
jgi:hypothetical protein